ncbi:YhcG family protein [Halomicronema sp. CCY15110]|jgi:predicted nuclease of restriction endonuclease-like (RecB) superfamily|uniref:PDDEXK nuclease domain-containing protein n=1 Tax=Halomicronema sp. CCY15110 TaxID=2767773 RepID=UPI00194F552E|nr:PDDEXK nuclease domain-containing protein [Halomicronema sp. CCY15110]
MPKSDLIPDDDYRELLEGLKERIRSSQIKAAIAVNRELIWLYWRIGRDILSRQTQEGWGSKVVNRLSADLRREFPDMTGFSPRNLKYMRAFAEAFPDERIVLQVVAQIPWGHSQVLLNKLDDLEQRLWYAQQTLENGWSRSILTTQIEADRYRYEAGVINNFETTLPPPQSDLVYQTLKDPYNLDFLAITRGIQEKDFKRAVVARMREFLLELGFGFSFVKQNYRVDVGGREFIVDLLFYHIRLRCFVVIQLEMDSFQPEQSGLMNFYLSAVDEQERQSEDQPTIGIILCKDKDRTMAEYSLRGLSNPIAIAEHRIPGLLPSTEQLELELEHAVKELDSDQEP